MKQWVTASLIGEQGWCHQFANTSHILMTVEKGISSTTELIILSQHYCPEISILKWGAPTVNRVELNRLIY